MKTSRFLTVSFVLGGAALAALVSCGGGGGGGGTVINGNMSGSQAFLSPAPGRAATSRFAWLSFVGTAWAQVTGVTVCLTGSTTICDDTDEEGFFTLPVDGPLVAPVCLTFTGSDFTADLCLDFDIPVGSAVQISNITCSTSNGTCQAEDVDIEEADEPSDVSASEPSDEDEPSDPSDPSDFDDPSDDDEPDPSDDD